MAKLEARLIVMVNDLLRANDSKQLLIEKVV